MEDEPPEKVETRDSPTPSQSSGERCPECDGTGKRDGERCPACEGSGNVMHGLGGG
jgi:DnaJ-class molecular chaperone